MFLLCLYVPRAAINFHSHANSSTMMTVGKESQLASDQNWIQFTFLGYVRVRISRHDLNESIENFLF